MRGTRRWDGGLFSRSVCWCCLAVRESQIVTRGGRLAPRPTGSRRRHPHVHMDTPGRGFVTRSRAQQPRGVDRKQTKLRPRLVSFGRAIKPRSWLQNAASDGATASRSHSQIQYPQAIFFRTGDFFGAHNENRRCGGLTAAGRSHQTATSTHSNESDVPHGATPRPASKKKQKRGCGGAWPLDRSEYPQP